MKPGSAVFLVVGIVLFGAGLLTLGGIVSLTAVGALNNAGLSTAFVVTTNAGNTSVTLQLANSCPTVPGLLYTTNTTVTFGDGSTWAAGNLLPGCQTPVANGGSLASGPYSEPSIVHKYGAAGTFTITDTIVEVISCNSFRPVGVGGSGSGCQSSGPVTATTSNAYAVTVPSSNGSKVVDGGGSITIGNNGGTNIQPGFTATISGLSLTVTDTSTATNQSVKSVSFNFGDNGVVTLGGGGGTVVHNYTQGGNYTVYETVTGSSVGTNGRFQMYTVSRTLQMVGTTTCITNPNTAGCPHNSVTVSTNPAGGLSAANLSIGVLLTVVGLSVIVGALIPMAPWKYLVPVAGTVLGVLSYVALGGAF